jgi:DNA polymerase-3 subunit beta
MKFTILRDELLKGLTLASRVIPQKSINPILTNVKLDLSTDSLTLTGSNGEYSLTTKIDKFSQDKEVIRDIIPGSILTQGYIFSEIVRRMSGNEVTFIYDTDSIADISDGKTEFKLNCQSPEDYLEIDFSSTGTKISFPTKLFIDCVNQVAFAASMKDARPTLTAVNVESDGTNISFVATDGARLAKKVIDVTNTDRFNANIPSKTLFEVVRTITSESEISVYISDKKVLFALNNTLISSRLIGGDYPSTRNIIPKTFSYFLEVNSQEFLNAMDRVSILSSDRENIVKLSMRSTSVIVSSKSQQAGSGEESLNLYKFTGEPLEISFNAGFVSSAIKALHSEDVRISFLGEMKPFVVSDKNDVTVTQLITPVRTY